MGYCNCCCCSTISSLIILLGFLLCMFLYSKNPDIFIENAVLTQFDINTFPETKTVNYNLTVDVKLRNFNKFSRIQYHRLGVTAFFEGEKLARAPLPVFRQGHKSNNTLTAVINGTTGPIEVSDSSAGFIQTAKEAGVFILNFEVDGKNHFRTAGTRTIRSSFTANCHTVLVAFSSSLTASSPPKSGKGFTFSPAKCKYPDLEV